MTSGRRRPRGTPPPPAPAAAGRRGVLFVVGTPIGNLDDLSERAVATLRRCRLVACEDTRVTRAILDRHGLGPRVMSCHKFNEAATARRLLAILDEGGDVALVSDGGTPALSDPGALVVREARRAGFCVVPIPGPSAVTALWSVSGFTGPFTMIGFLPHRRGERRRALEALRGEPRPLVLFESPHRILDLLEDAAAVLGDRICCVGREMTKQYEEFLEGPLSRVRADLAARTVRGEFALIVAGPTPSTSAPAAGGLEAAVEAARGLMGAGTPLAEAARRAARAAGVPRRAVYQRLLDDRPALHGECPAGFDSEE